MTDKSPRTLIAENLASLNEIVTELVAKVADPDEFEFVELVRNTLRDHSWSIGMAFQGERPPANWVAQLEAQHSEPPPSTYYDEESRQYHRRPAGMAFQAGSECTGANDGTCPKHPLVNCE